MHISYRKAIYIILLCKLLPICVFSQNHRIEIETDCLKFPSGKTAGLVSLIERLKSSGNGISEAYDSMKHYYLNNNIPYDCSFTLTCDNCDGPGYMYFPIKAANAAHPENRVYGSRAGGTGGVDIEQLYSNKLHVVNEAIIDITPIREKEPDSDEVIFLEYVYKEETHRKQMPINSKQEITLNKADLYRGLNEREIEKIDNKIYIMSKHGKNYLSSRTFKVYFFNNDEKSNIKKALLKYKNHYPNSSDDEMINNCLEMLNLKYGAVLHRDLATWYKTLN